ncbi:MAG: Gfo/Idh/MocA family oxidoreductase [Verrucomicrobia bacterium]|nr:Gfo/Idh/MocA family oxidoreductase [Verrucomicrobiota bacterium]
MKIALLGIGHFHSPIYVGAVKKLGHAIVGLHEDDPKIAALKQEKIGLPVGTDPAAVLDREIPDFVICMGSHRRMPELLELVIGRGLPFLVEKPAGRSSTQVLPLAQQCVQKKLFNAVAFCFRWHPGLRFIRDTLASGQAGRVGRLHLHYFAGPIARYSQMHSPWMLDPNETGGGSLLNLGVHCLDMLHFLGFSPALEHGSGTWAIRQANIEDLSTLVLRCGNAYALVESGYCCASPKTGFTLSILAEKANIEFQHGKVRLNRTDGTIEQQEFGDSDYREEMTRDLLDASRNGNPSPVDLSTAIKALTLADQFYSNLQPIR